MSLRTYSLITHPAFIQHVEVGKNLLGRENSLSPSEVPQHRPRLTSIYDVADYLGVSRDLIRSLLVFKKKHYREFQLKKRSGGTRTISAPRTHLKVVQWWILDTILTAGSVPPYVFGFVKGRSFIDNARQHIGATHALNVDLESFFPSISSAQVQLVFEQLGYDKEIARGFTELVTYLGSLPQGAPTSPMLANLAFAAADLRLQQLAEGEGLKYSRYADDLTFSSKLRISSDTLAQVVQIIEMAGFKLNDKKTRFYGPNQLLEVTGLAVTTAGVCLTPKYINGTRGWLHRLVSNPGRASVESERIRGTVELARAVGGRGSDKIITLGESALKKVEEHTYT